MAFALIVPFVPSLIFTKDISFLLFSITSLAFIGLIVATNFLNFFPLISQLITSNGELKYEIYITDNSSVDFNNIDSGKYFIRIIFDENKNQKYDSGNFLLKIKPEKESRIRIP